MSQAGGRAVQARVLSRRGEHEAAEDLAREAVAIMAETDYLDQHAEPSCTWPTCSRRRKARMRPWPRLREAMALYERKGATFFVEQEPSA